MINESYIIRPAVDADSSEIIKLIFDIWQNEYHFQVHLQDYPDLQFIEEYYTHQGGGFFVALVEDEIVSTIAYEKLNEQIFALKRMFVRQGFRGQGIAQKLLDTLLKNVPAPATFYLSTKEDLAEAAKKFYLKNGFSIINPEQLPSEFPFFYEDDLFMKKDLGF